ncbi:MAG TPA: GTPase ObgE, partial [Candidatus Udaeobacter sp.]|nr:GTPase ObgE [Candidatus Udaeobacter sp.]
MTRVRAHGNLSNMFVDRVKVFAQAGSGGRGCVSFRREKFVPKGGPDGGDGGQGGNVILRADRHVDNLANLFYEPLIKAKSGAHGKGKKMAGRAGADKIVKVPVGTVVWPAEEEKHPTPNVQGPTSSSEQSAIPVIDLARDGQEFVLCRGGTGGKGNVHFKSSRNRAPRQYTDGEEGEHGYFR